MGEPKMRRDDPDETEGRALYRAKADALARAQIALGSRRVVLKSPARVSGEPE